MPANTSATVHVPITGLPEQASVAESGKPILAAGKPAEKAEGAAFLHLEPGFAVFAVDAGRYEFETGG